MMKIVFCPCKKEEMLIVSSFSPSFISKILFRSAYFFSIVSIKLSVSFLMTRSILLSLNGFRFSIFKAFQSLFSYSLMAELKCLSESAIQRIVNIEVYWDKKAQIIQKVWSKYHALKAEPLGSVHSLLRLLQDDLVLG